jgi:MoxR-like ATPase
MNKSVEELDVLIRAAHPVVYVVSHEEHRVAQALAGIVEGKNKLSDSNSTLWTWSFTEGAYCGKDHFPDIETPLEILDKIGEHEQSAVFLLKDFGYWLNEGPCYPVQRKLRDLTSSMNPGITIVIIDSELKIPPRLEKVMSVVDFDLPSVSELSDWTTHIVEDFFGDSVKPKDKKEMLKVGCRAALGLTLGEVENVFSKSLAKCEELNPRVVMEEKKHIIRKSGVLQYHDVDREMKDVGGLITLKSWLGQRGKAFSAKAREFGLPHPKGVLIVGIPGTGKSLTAKCIGAAWNMPVLRMDVGALFGQYVGQSEANFRKAIKTAEAISPCVLWIDEIEKGFGSASGSHDSGTSARVFGSFLSWMSEKTSQVFVVATANDVSALPPEMLRKGRFDELFFVDLPNAVDREEVFKIHLSRLGRDADKYSLPELVEITDAFTGAEIEQVVVDGLYSAFDQERDLENEDMLAAASRTVPLAVTMEKRINDLRKWAHGRAIRANDEKATKSNKKPVKSRRTARVVSEKKDTKPSGWDDLKKAE